MVGFFNNKSPRTKTFTKAPAFTPKQNLGGVPKFQQKTGVRPGTAPVTGGVVAPTLQADSKALLSSFPGPKGYPGTITLQH